MTETNVKTDDGGSAAVADQRLLARVRAAVAERIPANALEAYAGQRPLINTTAGDSLAMLRRVDFQPDPEHADETLVRTTATAVVYWTRPVPSHDPRVVGIQFRQDGAAALFFAIIPPP